MAYVTIPAVQQWLQASKYEIDAIDSEHEQVAADVAFTLLARRYDTTTWLSDSTTPALVLNTMTMLVASYALRKAIGEDDGEHDYPDWLESRAIGLLTGISEGLLDIPGIDPDPGAVVEGAPAFWPTQAATDLWFEDPTAEDAAALAFTMQQVF
jgi:hypothetical protein